MNYYYMNNNNDSEEQKKINQRVYDFEKEYDIALKKWENKKREYEIALLDFNKLENLNLEKDLELSISFNSGKCYSDGSPVKENVNINTLQKEVLELILNKKDECIIKKYNEFINVQNELLKLTKGE